MPYKPDNPHHEASPSCFHMNVVFDHASQPLAVQSRILSRSLTIAPFNLIRFSPASLLGSRLHSDLDGATAVHLFQGILKVMDREYIGNLEIPLISLLIATEFHTYHPLYSYRSTIKVGYRSRKAMCLREGAYYLEV